MDDHQQQQSIISNGSNDYHQPPQSSSQSFDQSMPSFTENSIGDVTMESVASPSIRAPGVGHQDGSEQARIADGGPIPIASKKRKRAEIAPSELRDLGLLPASRHASPSQSRSGSRAASPAIASTSSAQINTNPSRDKSSAKKSSRNIDRVFFGAYEIKTWYYSPYPFEEEDWLAFNPSTKPEENRTNLSRRSSGKASENNVAGGSSKSSNKRAGSESSAASPSISTFNHSTQDLTNSSSSIGGALGSSVHEAPVLSNSVDNTKSNPSTNDIAKDRKSERKMWVCDGCFKYMRSYAGWNSHKKQCTFTHPPGKKVYQRGAHIIWEVDGAQAKLYAQNLSLFGKLFIDHKTIYFDVEPFTFYVLTDATTQFDHALGYFSKEKVSYDDYNLACIITFPPFQQKGFGTLMIEFSYYLSSLTDIPGTPERPLSDLGLKGYLSFWSSVVLRTLVIAFNDIDSPSICLPYVGNKLQSSNAPASVEKLRIECLRIRRILLGLPPLSEEILRNKSQRKNSESNQDGMLVNGEEKPKRHSYGWAGEIKRLPSSSSSSSSSISLDSRHLPSSSQNQISASTTLSPSSSSTTTSTTANQSNPNTSGRTLRTRSDKGKEKAESLSPPPPISNINSTSQLLDLDGETTGSFQLRTNLERIAEATNLRLEDCSQALMECGLMSWKIPHEHGAHENGIRNGIDSGGGGEGDLTLMISLDKVREGIRKKGVKRQMLDVNYVL